MNEPSFRLNYSLKYPLDRRLCSSGPNLDAIGAGKSFRFCKSKTCRQLNTQFVTLTELPSSIDYLVNLFALWESTGNLEEWVTWYSHTKLHVHLMSPHCASKRNIYCGNKVVWSSSARGDSDVTTKNRERFYVVPPDLSTFGNSWMVEEGVGACNNSKGKKVKVNVTL